MIHWPSWWQNACCHVCSSCLWCFWCCFCVCVCMSFLCVSSMHSVQTSILYFLIRYWLIAQALLFFSYAYVVLVVNIGQKTSGRSVRRVNTRPVVTGRHLSTGDSHHDGRCLLAAVLTTVVTVPLVTRPVLTSRRLPKHRPSRRAVVTGVCQGLQCANVHRFL